MTGCLTNAADEGCLACRKYESCGVKGKLSLASNPIYRVPTAMPQ